MNRDNEMDDLLRKRFESKKFELKENYWNNARKLMDVDRFPERGNITFSMLSDIMIVALLSLVLYQSQLSTNITALQPMASSEKLSPAPARELSNAKAVAEVRLHKPAKRQINNNPIVHVNALMIPVESKTLTEQDISKQPIASSPDQGHAEMAQATGQAA